jgi:hypothetical protein
VRIGEIESIWKICTPVYIHFMGAKYKAMHINGRCMLVIIFVPYTSPFRAYISNTVDKRLLKNQETSILDHSEDRVLRLVLLSLWI